MATSNVRKKIAALAELRKDPAAAIETAWKSIQQDAGEAAKQPVGWEVQEHHVDLISQIIGAVVADIRAEKKGEAAT